MMVPSCHFMISFIQESARNVQTCQIFPFSIQKTALIVDMGISVIKNKEVENAKLNNITDSIHLSKIKLSIY